MAQISNPRALKELQLLDGQTLNYGLKSPDMELYDFGFGKIVTAQNIHGKVKKISSYILHAICRFKVINKITNQTEVYYEDTPSEVFDARVKHLVGLKVKRVALSQKNDLWLDFGDYWVVFATYENGEESWRFFQSNPDSSHLVASNSSLDMV